MFSSKLIWISLSILSALFDCSVHLLTKKALFKSGQYLVPAMLCLIAGIACFIMHIFFVGFPEVGWDFYELALFVSIMAGAGMIFFTAGLEKSEVSYAIPLLCTIPLMSAIWGWILIGEIASFKGLIGVLVVMIGAYMLELHKMKDGVFEPLRAMMENQNARLILIASMLWSVTSIVDKIGVIKGSPLLWSCTVSTGMGLIILFTGLVKKKISRKHVIESSWPILILLGILYAGMHFCQMTAIQTGQVSYVLSIKRIGILLSVILGSLIFKEQNLRERFVASAVMILGVCIIIFYA